jgi:hypothetical protein
MLRIKKLNSSTLPETIISLIILLSSFSIAVMIISSLYKETISENETLVHIKLQEFKNKTLTENLYFDESINYKNFLLVKNVIPSKFNTNLILLKFYALSPSNDTLEKQERLVCVHESSIMQNK